MTLKQLLMISAVGLTMAMVAPTYADEPLDPDECGASALQDRIGEPVTGTTAEDLHVGGERVTTANVVRVVEEGGPMTMDFHPDRLTIEVDEDGNLVSARCV